MKIAKKLSSAIIAVVVCSMLVVTAWAAVTYVTYKGELSPASITVSEEVQTVTLTVKADKDVTTDAFQAQVTVPEGWSVKSISNEQLEDKGVLIVEEGGMIWYSAEAEDVDVDLLATAVIEVPANTAAGTYDIAFEIVEMSRGFGSSWDNGEPITATLTIEAAEEECDHIETETTTDYVNNGDDHTVTVTCQCGEVISSVTEGHVFNDGVCNCGATEPTDPSEPKAGKITWMGADGTMLVEKDYEGGETPEYPGETPVKEGYTFAGWSTEADGAGTQYPVDTALPAVDGDATYYAYFTEDGSTDEPDDPNPGTGLKGDVNLDGTVGPADLTALARHVAEIKLLTDETALANADVTGDGSAGPDDLTKLARYVAEIIDSLD